MLAAEHVDRLIESGLSVQRVVADFFIRSYDRQVIGRAQGPMLAWLASMQPTILRQMIAVAPELLIEGGDPRVIALEDRVEALKRHVACADALPGGFHFQQADLRRFAEPELEPQVVQLLSRTVRGEGLLHLLQVVGAGRYATASRLLVQEATDPFTPSAVRVHAMAALVECGGTDDLDESARILLAWGAPLQRPGDHSFERQRDDDVRHRLVRRAYPGAIDARSALRLLAQIAGKEWSSNAKLLPGAMAMAPADDLQELVVGLDRLCFPRGDGTRPQAAPPASARLPDLFRALVALVGRIIRERPDLHSLLVPIHDRCLRTVRYTRGHSYTAGERAQDLYGITQGFRFAILEAYASGSIAARRIRVFEQILQATNMEPSTAVADAPRLLDSYVSAGINGRRVYGEALTIWIRNMPDSDASVWRRKLSREAKRHAVGKDAETLASVRWRLIATAVRTVKRWRADLPWRAENAWIVFRAAARERWSDCIALCRDFPRLADGRAIGTILSRLEAEGSEDFLVLDPDAARRRRFGSRLVRGAIAHARRHEPSGQRGVYVWPDLLAFAGWGYAWRDDQASLLAMPNKDAARALLIALTSPSIWPAWASELAAARPDVFREVISAAVGREAVEHRASDPRITPHVLGRLSELEPSLRATVASKLVSLAAGTWLPGFAAVLALRRIADNDAPALAELRHLARRRGREAAWEGSTARVAEWLKVWAADDPAAIVELLALRDGPLAGDQGASAMVRALEPLLSRDHEDGDRLAPLATGQLLALASHLTMTFSVADDDHREGIRVRDDRRRGEEVRGAVLKLLGGRHDAEGRAALEDFIKRYIEPKAPRWACAWLAGHARDAAEPGPWGIEEIASYGSLTTRRPRSAQGLLDAVLQGLRDIELDLASSEFDRRALFREASEADVRAFIGHELDRRHRDHYAITQETVTAGEKRTDLRCELRGGDGSVTVVELKLLHGWTWAELIDKLVTQLLQQYLISDRVAQGIYLLVDIGQPPKGETPPDGIVDVEGLLQALRDVVRDDGRFHGRVVEIMRLRIDVPPPRSRKARKHRAKGSLSPAKRRKGERPPALPGQE